MTTCGIVPTIAIITTAIITKTLFQDGYGPFNISTVIALSPFHHAISMALLFLKMAETQKSARLWKSDWATSGAVETLTKALHRREGKS
jgi:hypothetical protein